MWKFYDPTSGALLEQVTYLYGSKDGNDIYYYKGRQDHIDHYKNGTLIKGAGKK